MTNYDEIDFSPLVAAHRRRGRHALAGARHPSRLRQGARPHHARQRARPHPAEHAGSGHAAPSSARRSTRLKARAAAGEIQAVGITGKQYILAAGADLSDISKVGSKDNARLIAQLGHQVFGKLSELGVPSFAFVNGLALGGGLEIALNSTYRTVDASAAAIALPEVFLGIIPGWGGAYLLPNLIGIENALEVVISNPLKQNRMLKPQQAFDYGIVDAIFPAANYLEDSLRVGRRRARRQRSRCDRKNEPGKIERLTKWPIAIKMARGMLESKIGTVPKSPYAALELLDKAKSGTKAEGFAREDEALAELVTGDQFAASMYAFDLVQKRAKRPVGAPDKALAKKVTKVGIIGAGLMASQFALLFVRKLQVPVLITDLDQARVDKGVAYIHDEIGKLEAKGRLDGDAANRLRALRHRHDRQEPSTRTATSSSRPCSKRSASSSRCSARSSRSSPRTRSSRPTPRRCRSRRSARSSPTRSGSSASTSSTRWRSCRSSRS